MSDKISVIIKWVIAICIASYLFSAGTFDEFPLIASILFGIGGVWGIAYVIDAVKSFISAFESPGQIFMVIVYLVIAPIMGLYHAVVDTVKAFIG